MMELFPLTVGPIVGETTDKRARIWGRGQAHVVDDVPRRCFGALHHRRKGAPDWERPMFFKMNPNFDLTGIAVVRPLEPETTYEYEMGYFYSDVELQDARVGRVEWGAASKGSFTTASNADDRPRTLAIGSCRYLLKTFLGSFFDSRGDKTFRSILDQMKDGQGIDQLIMMGDQIYADDLNAFNPDKTVRQFYRRYRDAFSQTHIRKLMSRVPTYMTLDDHEIEDNWPSEATEKDWKTLFPVAIHAFQAYQLSHSPNIPVRGARLRGTPDHLWYSYSDGCCDIFVTDSRTERYLAKDAPGPREMISVRQMSALKRWLNDGSGRVKIVVTSVPFFPDSSSGENPDKWSGFEHQRNEILRHVERNQIRKVVFFSGDVHASFSGELLSPTNLKLLSVVSSAFFWPYPHPRARHFQRTGQLDAGSAGVFRLSNFSRVVSDDNFSRVRVTPTSLTVSVFSRKGRLRHEKAHQF